jgi:hypothetical protein
VHDYTLLRPLVIKNAFDYAFSGARYVSLSIYIYMCM